jgi:hypothetical protein
MEDIRQCDSISYKIALLGEDMLIARQSSIESGEFGLDCCFVTCTITENRLEDCPSGNSAGVEVEIG